MQTDRDYDSALGRVLELRRTVASVHPLLSRVFPVAIVENDRFLVYETDTTLARFVQTTQAPVSMPLPERVRAAFPLECLGNRAACVVTFDAFDSLDGYSFVFHEFVHCYQWETCEPRLKEQLSIARAAASHGDYTWELNYPFPYVQPAFVSAYRSFLEAVQADDLKRVYRSREALSTLLPEEQYEYMLWQEWKEGLARYIENIFRQSMGLAENHGGTKEPLDRVVFYEGGSGFVRFLETVQPGISVRMEGLFDAMRRPPQ